jgi:hypothetical protein
MIFVVNNLTWGDPPGVGGEAREGVYDCCQETMIFSFLVIFILIGNENARIFFSLDSI